MENELTQSEQKQTATPLQNETVSSSVESDLAHKFKNLEEHPLYKELRALALKYHYDQTKKSG